MADITMCNGKDCPSKYKCYRFLATPSLYSQCWSNFDTEKKEGTICENFMPCNSKDQFRRLER